MTDALKIKNLIFSYPGANTNTIEVGHLDLKMGEKTFLQGPSGSGKSTLLNLIGGVLKPQSGRIEILGSNICQLNASQKDRFRANHIGFIFQQFNLISYMNVIENVLLPLKYSKKRGKRCLASNPTKEAERLLEHLGLEEKKTEKVTDLSVGQQQRVAVARALLGKPEIIIADEPTSALDFSHQEKFVNLLLDEVKENNASLLFVSHNPTLSAHFDRLLNINDLKRGGGHG